MSGSDLGEGSRTETLEHNRTRVRKTNNERTKMEHNVSAEKNSVKFKPNAHRASKGMNIDHRSCTFATGEESPGCMWSLCRHSVNMLLLISLQQHGGVRSGIA